MTSFEGVIVIILIAVIVAYLARLDKKLDELRALRTMISHALSLQHPNDLRFR